MAWFRKFKLDNSRQPASHMDGNATGGVTTWQLYISVVTGTGPASYEFVVFTAVSESDRHSHAWAKCERSGLILSRENYN